MVRGIDYERLQELHQAMNALLKQLNMEMESVIIHGDDDQAQHPRITLTIRDWGKKKQ